MKKIFLLTIAVLFIQCSSSKKTVSDSKKTIEKASTSYQTKNDFRGLKESAKNEFLKQKNATAKNKCVLILSQGFKGEKIIAKQNDKTLYSEYPISHLKTKYADSFGFDNSIDLVVYDNFSKEEVIIKSSKLKGNKFVYLMKYVENEKTKYRITLSNTLRPM